MPEEVTLEEMLKNAKPDKAGWSAIPPGSYKATVESATFGKASSGNPMFTVFYELDDGETDSEGNDLGGKKIRHYITITSKNVDIAVRQLEALGTTQAELTKTLGRDGDGDTICATIVDAPVTIKVKDDGEYNGAPSSKVSFIDARKASSPFPSASRSDDTDTEQPRAARPARPF